MLPLVSVVDLTLFVMCSLFLVRFGRISFTHPAVIYLLFHFMFVTVRTIYIVNGAPTFFDTPAFLRAGYLPASHDEIARAVIYCDLALVAVVAGVIWGASHHRRYSESHPVGRVIYLVDQRIVPFSILFFIIGIWGVISFSRLPGGVSSVSFDPGSWGTSTWLRMTESWTGLALIILMYRFGFKKLFVILFAVFLFIMIYQGYDRFRTILLSLFCLFIYLDRRGLKWPPLWMVITLVVGMLIFFPLKTIGLMLQQGEPIDTIVNTTINTISSDLNNGFGSEPFLDQLAMALTLIDRQGQYYYFNTYLPLITLPIPRPLWPDKPRVAFYMFDLQTPQRPVAQMGMIITLVGESYLSFGILGVVVIPVLLSYLLARFYFIAYRRGYFSIAHFTYLTVAASLLQIYRDGLSSIVVFVLVAFMPMVLLALNHWLLVPKENSGKMVPEMLLSINTPRKNKTWRNRPEEII